MASDAYIVPSAKNYGVYGCGWRVVTIGRDVQRDQEFELIADTTAARAHGWSARIGAP